MPSPWVAGDELDADDLNARTADISCRVKQNSPSGIVDGAGVTLSFGAEDFDTDTMHSTVSGNRTKITFTKAGKYHVGAQIQIDIDAEADLLVFIKLNGSTIIGMNRQMSQSPTGRIQIDTIYNFVAGDYITIELYGDANTNETSGNANTNAWAYRI